MTIESSVQQWRESPNHDHPDLPNGTQTVKGKSITSQPCVYPFSFCSGSDESCLSYFFILRKNNEKVESVWSHPIPFDAVETLYPMVTQFVFPTSGMLYSMKDFNHTFVFTDSHGVRMYGHCTVFVNGDTVVSLSPYPWCSFFTRLAMLFHINGYEHGKEIVYALCKCPTPPSGGTFMMPTTVPMEFQRPYDRLCSFIDTSPVDLFTIFPQTSVLFSLLADLLLEKHIIVSGPNFGLVSHVVMSLQTLISPFDWMHMLIPVLPSSLLDVLAAPVPYLVGTLTSQLSLLEKVPIERVIIICLGSSGKCEKVSYYGEEKHTLPNSGIFSALRLGYSIIKMRDPQDQSVRDLCSLFLTYYATLLGDIGVGGTETHMKSQSELKDNAFYTRFKSTQCYNTVVETVQKALVDKNLAWMDNEFIVALVRGHAYVYPRHYQQLIQEEKEGRGYTERYENCFGSMEQMTAVSAAIHGFGGHQMSTGRLICSCLRNFISCPVYEKDGRGDMVIVEDL